MDLVGLRLAPALTAGVIAFLHSDDLGEALIVFAAMLAATQLIERPRFPLALMPAARVWRSALAAPVVAGAALLGVTALAGHSGRPRRVHGRRSIGAWLMLGARRLDRRPGSSAPARAARRRDRLAPLRRRTSATSFT